MLVRALVVLLLVLNVGVAAWWTLRTPPAPPSAVETPLGVAKLRLVREVRAPAPAPVVETTARAPVPAAAPAPTVASAPATPAVAAATPPRENDRCFSVGPFADAAAAGRARELLLAVASTVATREQRSGSPSRGWRVYVPAAASPEEATAIAQRIAAAGFSDYFIVRQGSEANSIALGRYRSEQSARRRADSLTAAGFAVRAEPLGEGKVSVWLDLVARPEFDPARAEAAVLVPARPLDCAKMR